MTEPYPTYFAVQPHNTRPALDAGFFRLARVLQALLGLAALMQVVLMAVDVYYLRFAARLIDTPEQVTFEEFERFDQVTMLTGLGSIGLLILTAGAFISWLFQAHRSNRMHSDRLRHKSFWAIIGWFVPIMNLFRPYAMIDDTRRGVAPGAWTPTVQKFWWAAWLIGGFGDRVVVALWPTGDEPDLEDFGEKLRVAVQVELGVSAISIAAAILAILVVREITARLTQAPPFSESDRVAPTPPRS